MNITKEAVNDLNAIIHINLKEEDYIEEVNSQLADYRKKASIPGFRPGKVPMGMVKKMYGKSVLLDAVNKKVSEGLNNFIIENKLNILGYPLPNPEKSTTIDFDTQKDFDFYFDIGISPEFEFELSEEIKVPYYKIKVTAKEVDKAINDVKLRFGEEEHPEKAEITDALQGRFTEVDENGEVINDGIKNDGYIRIEDVKLKTIQNKLVGSKIGDKVVINLMKAFKDESKVKSLLNLHDGPDNKLSADYEFEVTSVIRVQEAKVNEDLFKKVYPNDDIKEEKAFKTKVKADLSAHYSRDTDRQFLADTINEVIKANDLQLPDEFMKRWLLENNKDKMTREQLDEQYDSYAKTFKWQLIESKLQEQLGDEIKVSENEVRDKVKAYFKTMGGDADSNPQIEAIVDSVLQNQEEKQRIYNDLLDEKFIKSFKEHVKIQEKEVDSEKFFEIASNTK
ncbi:MAG: trigger factor [Bacteroidales bacterium]|jgi:trigger factor|nr:trigger factor [Bacteroidales bacterium]